MGLLENARYASIERGYDYYKKGNVIAFKQTSENEYEGKVSGSEKKPYDVHINIIQFKKSFCNFPFVGRQQKGLQAQNCNIFFCISRKSRGILQKSQKL